MNHSPSNISDHAASWRQAVAYARLAAMPPSKPAAKETKSIEQIVDDGDYFSADAYRFVEEGLSFTVQRIHRERTPAQGRHISGQQLCEGLRDYAIGRWGMMARTVLKRWGVTSTMDFGRIVYILIENGRLAKTEQDSIEDFRNVFDFATTLESSYRIPSK